jgi:peptide/nickel transport system permease protein
MLLSPGADRDPSPMTALGSSEPPHLTTTAGSVVPGVGGPSGSASGERRGRARSAHPLAMFLGRRVGAGILTLLVASLLVFLATNALPGNVAEVLAGRNATPAVISRLDGELKLNEPVLSRYGTWLAGLIQGDFGKSAVAVVESNTDSSVASQIGTPFRNSLILAGITIVLLVPLALLIGTLSAVNAGRSRDYVASYFTLVLGALPEFVLGTLLIVVFFSLLNWLPPVSLIPPGSSPLAHVNELVLPVLTLLGVSLAFCARQVRAGVLTVLGEEYVTMARLSGVREARVIMRYALRNAVAPSIQTFAQAFQYLFGGIIVVETLFAYPGVGQALVQAVSVRDVTVVQAIAVVLAATYIAINIAADLLVVLVVPRLRTGLR